MNTYPSPIKFVWNDEKDENNLKRDREKKSVRTVIDNFENNQYNKQ